MKILIIQILRLGDALQLTPVARSLKILYPEAQISILTSSLGKEIFSRQKFVDEIFIIRKEEIKELSKKSQQQSINTAFEYLQNDLLPVLSQKWDWVINLSFSVPSAILAFLAHGKRNSGFYATENREYISRDKWFFYTLSSFPNRKYSLFNWVDINSNIVKAHNVPKFLNFPVHTDESSWVNNILNGFLANGEELIGFHPGASGPHKMWPIENFISLAQSLIASGKKIVIFGDKSEQELGDKIKDANGNKVMNLTGQTTLGQAAALMSRCSLIVCNDSGPMHLASAVGTPVLALFFSTHFVETGPYGENNLILHPILDCFPCLGTASCIHKKCLEFIPVEAVSHVINSRYNILLNPVNPSPSFPQNVAVNRSRFDEEGFLEWLPAITRPIDLDTLIRIILKLSFIPCLRERDMDSEDRIRYARQILNYFSWTLDESGVITSLKSLIPLLRDLKSLIIELLDICTELYNDSYDFKKNLDSITRLGTELQAKEDSIVNHTSQYLDIIIKYIEMARNNITERDFQSLAAQNIKVYSNAADLLDRIKDNIYLVSRIATERTVFHEAELIRSKK